MFACGVKMIFNEFLQWHGVDPASVLLMRHTPSEPQLRQALRQLAMTRHDLFNAYQQVQRPHHRTQIANARFVAALVGVEPGVAEFVGLYKRGPVLTITPEQYWSSEENRELQNYGLKGASAEDRDHVWVELVPIARFWNFQKRAASTALLPSGRCRSFHPQSR